MQSISEVSACYSVQRCEVAHTTYKIDLKPSRKSNRSQHNKKIVLNLKYKKPPVFIVNLVIQ